VGGSCECGNKLSDSTKPNNLLTDEEILASEEELRFM
jgi:hypothetical protein